MREGMTTDEKEPRALPRTKTLLHTDIVNCKLNRQTHLFNFGFILRSPQDRLFLDRTLKMRQSIHNGSSMLLWLYWVSHFSLYM